MAMRVATRRVADQLRYSPAVLNGNRLFQSSGPDAQQGTPKPVPMSKLKDSFLDGTSSTYLEDMEERYRQDPSSVDKSWASFFRSLGKHKYFAILAGLCYMYQSSRMCVDVGKSLDAAEAVIPHHHCQCRVWSSTRGCSRGISQFRTGREDSAFESGSNLQPVHSGVHATAAAG